MPRRAGRSGCVLARGMPCPASTRALRDGTANSAVPAKTIFRKALARRRGDGLGLFVLLSHQVFDAAQRVEAGQPVREEDSVQVVQLVLKGASRETVGLDAHLFAVAIHPLAADPLLAPHLADPPR